MRSQQQDNLICGFGIVVFDYEEYKIDQTIDSLMNINLNKRNYKIVLSTRHNEKAGELFNYINIFKSNEISSELIITLDPIDVEKEAYLKCIGATHLVKINSGDKIDSNLLFDINQLVFSDPNKYKAFEKNGIKVINFHTVNNLYLNFNSFDLLFDSLKNGTEYINLDEK